MSNADQVQLEQIVGEPIIAMTPGRWGFTNRTDIVTLAGGDQVVVQRYRRRKDSEYRLRVMQALRAPAAQSGIVIPAIRQFDLDADPPWAIFEPLPGLPVPEAGDASLDGPRFPFFARRMGELLARLRRLPTTGLALNDDWADPSRLAARAAAWVEGVPELSHQQRAALALVIDQWPTLFSDRQSVLAHGDFAPVNVLIDGESVTGLVDFESVRLADPLFDAAWWTWAVEFHDPSVLQRAWRPFLEGAEINPDEPQLAERIRALQTLRLLELVVDPNAIGSDIRRMLVNRLQAILEGKDASFAKQQ
jgi:aminoglycoside phosphotransferase (APT) family kinase protein